jgi:hypothetical protein
MLQEADEMILLLLYLLPSQFISGVSISRPARELQILRHYARDIVDEVDLEMVENRAAKPHTP